MEIAGAGLNVDHRRAVDEVSIGVNIDRVCSNFESGRHRRVAHVYPVHVDAGISLVRVDRGSHGEWNIAVVEVGVSHTPISAEDRIYSYGKVIYSLAEIREWVSVEK